MNSISTEKLDIAYDDTLIVKALDMNIPHGKITSIIGPNGCGKSTVLKAVGRILKPKTGLVYLSGDDIRKLSTKEIAKKMAILPQTPTAPSGLTVSELVAYGRFPHQKGFGKLMPEDKKIIQWALKVTKLTEFEHREVDTLSGGQRQRVWIAMALAQQTDILLLDEPTTFLDITYQVEILDLLTDLNRKRGTTIVMVLHDINLSARYADYIFAVQKGNLIAQGEPSEVISEELMKQVFGLDCAVIKDPVSGSPFIVPKGRYHVVNA